MLAESYRLVFFDVVQVSLLCQTQVEELLPLSLHSISVSLRELHNSSFCLISIHFSRLSQIYMCF